MTEKHSLQEVADANFLRNVLEVCASTATTSIIWVGFLELIDRALELGNADEFRLPAAIAGIFYGLYIYTQVCNWRPVTVAGIENQEEQQRAEEEKFWRQELGPAYLGEDAN